MSEPEEVRAAEDESARPDADHVSEGGTAGSVGALGGTSAVTGGFSAPDGEASDGEVPVDAPDPSTGPD